MPDLAFSIQHLASDEQISVNQVHGAGIDWPFANKGFGVIVDAPRRAIIIKSSSKQVAGVYTGPDFEKISVQRLHLSQGPGGDQAREKK
jgi:hypothetical protein